MPGFGGVVCFPRPGDGCLALADGEGVPRLCAEAEGAVAAGAGAFCGGEAAG